MEGQINRIAAGEDLRKVNLSTANGSKDGFEAAIKRLTVEIGVPYKMRREIFVKPEPDAKAKFESLL